MKKLNGIKESLDSRVTDYPRGWELTPLGNLGIFLRGKGISKSETVDSGIPCVMYGEIYTQHHYFIKRFSSFINKEVASKSQRVYKGDLLFAGSGETMEEIGKSVALLSNVEAYAGGDIVILRPHNVNSLYLSFALNNGKLANERAKLGQGHSVVHVYSKDLQHLRIPLPPKEEQQKIVSILITWDKAIELKEKLIEQKKEQKKGLMQKLLSGRVRLPGFYGEWESKLMANCLKIMTGSPFKSEYFNEEMNGLPLIRIRDINSVELKTYYSGPYSDDYLITKGDVLIGMDGNFNITMWNKITGLLNQRVMKITAKDGYDLYFLYQKLNPELRKIEHLTPQTTVKHLSNKDVNGIKTKMPKLKEQQAIGEVLNNFDKEISLIENEVVYLKKQKQGLMQNLLTGKARVKV